MGCKSVDVGHFRVEVLRFIFDLYRLSGVFLSLIFSEVFEPEGVTEEKHIKDET